MSITGSTLLGKPITKEFLKNHITKWLKMTKKCTLEFREEDGRGFWVGCEHCGFCSVSISEDGMSVHTATYGMSRGEIGIAISHICEDILVEELGSGNLWSEMAPETKWIFDGKKWEEKVDQHFWENLEKEIAKNGSTEKTNKLT